MQQKSERIVRYTAEELRQKRAKGESLTDPTFGDDMTNDELEALIATDPDEAGWDYGWDNYVAFKGLPPLPKRQLTLRLDDDVVAYFKAQGRGYQTRMNAVLRAYVEAQQRADGEPNPSSGS